ncbi:MAG: hypothetical protein O2818_06150 [Bacteroidetes bacterium]|nr:hypothetical protein [Bacteroidota bacterium]MDA1336455.1 hypothetical protein [Bacteroidota bacterium]
MKNKIRLLLVSIGVYSLCIVSVSAQSSCTDCIPCGEGQPCCQIWNACNYSQTFCFSDTGCPSTVSAGCDMSCTPIDSGVLFLLLGGAAFGGLMIVRRRKEDLVLQSERTE